MRHGAEAMLGVGFFLQGGTLCELGYHRTYTLKWTIDFQSKIDSSACCKLMSPDLSSGTLKLNQSS